MQKKFSKKKVNDFKREVPNLKKELSDKKYTGVDDSILQEAILKALSTETKKRQASPTTIDHTPRQAKRSTSMPTRYSIAQLEYKRNALDKRLKQVETEIETVKEAQDKLNKENEELERMTINKDREIDEAKHLNYSFKHWYSNLVARYEKQKQEIAYLKAENIRLQRLQEEKDKFSLSIDLWDDGNTSVNDLDAMELWDTYEQSDGARINL